MHNRYRELIELRPVAQGWLLLWLALLGSFSAAMLLLADVSTPLTLLLLLCMALMLSCDCRSLAGQPDLVRCLPDGRWQGLWLARPPERKRFFLMLSMGYTLPGRWLLGSAFTRARNTSRNLNLERHFLGGTRSIVMLVRDSEGQKFRLWYLKNACPDPQWRRLRVLLRWPDTIKGQGNG